MPKSLSSIIAGFSGTKAILNFMIEKANSLPKADRLLEIMEESISKMPEEKRAEAQRKLDELKDDFLTNEEFQEAIDHITHKIDPENLNEEELEEVGDYIERELQTEQ